MVSSRLVYCNSLLYGLNKSSVWQLQKVQNALCRFIFNLNRKSYVSPYLQRLHWLPVHYRVLFKFNLLIYKALNLSQPPYLASLIKASPSARGKRLVSSHSAKNCMGYRSFVTDAPREWNNLPQCIRVLDSLPEFRSILKTYLFRLAYPPN